MLFQRTEDPLNFTHHNITVEKKSVMKFLIFGFVLGIDIGLKTIESIGGKQPFLVLFLLIKGKAKNIWKIPTKI